MMTLYVFGPNFGLPDPSPFCSKALVLMKMSGQEYRTRTADVRKAPKGKAPYLDDNGQMIADSSFIRMHLEKVHGLDFDAGLTPAEKATAWAVEKLCEDNLYWAIVRRRWMVDANFNAGPVQFFKAVPAPIRPLVVRMIRRQVRRDLHGQGLGRHSDEELSQLSGRGIDALSDILGDKPFLMGDQPCGADAAVFGTVSSLLCEHFEAPELAHAKSKPNLVAYRDRGLKRWFPDFIPA